MRVGFSNNFESSGRGLEDIGIVSSNENHRSSGNHAGTRREQEGLHVVAYVVLGRRPREDLRHGHGERARREERHEVAEARGRVVDASFEHRLEEDLARMLTQQTRERIDAMRQHKVAEAVDGRHDGGRLLVRVLAVASKERRARERHRIELDRTALERGMERS